MGKILYHIGKNYRSITCELQQNQLDKNRTVQHLYAHAREK
jgi:hypothetical protein